MDNPGRETTWERGYESASPAEVRRRSFAFQCLLLLPVVGFIVSLFLVRPLAIGGTFSLTFAAPGLLVLGLLLVRIPRDFVRSCLAPVRFEFFFLLVLVCLSFLSVLNADSPIRTFRIIYPSLLPFAIFAHLVFLRYYAPEKILDIPRLLVIGALVFSVMPLFASQVLPPLKSFLFGEYRMKGGFENSIQHSIALGVILPLCMVEFALAKTRARKVVTAILLPC